MATALDIITRALHLFGILDAAEEPQPSDIATCVPLLNDLLRSDHMDGAAQYLIKRTQVTLAPGVSGNVYSFVVGPMGNVPVDAVGVRQIWCNDISSNVNRETRQAPIADVVRTTYTGLITKWHQERQTDGSVLVTAWQPPRAATKILLEYGGRIPEITAADSVVGLPPEGIADASLLLGRRVCSAYGRAFEAAGPAAADAARVDTAWRSWARGAQWLRFVRA